MIEPDLEKCRQEIDELRNLPAVTIEIPLVAAMDIIGFIQLGTKNPVIAESESGKMAIEIARKLQNSLDQNSECFKLLEFGWELQAGMREIDSCEHQSSQNVQELKERVFKIFGFNEEETKRDQRA